ncbi:MAG TPA: M20 family metallopeptidase [Burkholderiales bacterium]|nr:M20 family metallopeptidase [Burkholderiales bacterium]
MTREAAIARVTRHFDDGSFIEDLARRVAFKTESQEPSSRPNLSAYLEQEIGPAFERMGYRVQIFDNPAPNGGPLLLAERIEDEALPTVLSYGHGDVIRGLDAQWRAGISPWQLTREDDRYYGRGTADNKGQHSVNMAALAAVIAERGRLGFNSKFLLETGEELGSPGLKLFCEREKRRLKADVFIASDGPRVSAQRATIFLGSRGALNLNFTVDLRSGAHHSGNWGGLLANPGVILAHALASIVARDGKVLARELLPASIPDSVRRALADCPVAPGPGEPAIDSHWGEPGLSAAEKVYAWNTFEVLAFRTGNPDNPVNAIPGRATATCQIRFVAGTDPDALLPALRRHLDANGFKAVGVEPARESLFFATRLDPDHPWVRWAADSIHRSIGARPVVLPNVGGSLPNECFSDVLGLATVWVPHSYAGCSQHAPNEHALGPVLREGLQIMTGLFWDLAERDLPA